MFPTRSCCISSRVLLLSVIGYVWFWGLVWFSEGCKGVISRFWGEVSSAKEVFRQVCCFSPSFSPWWIFKKTSCTLWLGYFDNSWSLKIKILVSTLPRMYRKCMHIFAPTVIQPTRCFSNSIWSIHSQSKQLTNVFLKLNSIWNTIVFNVHQSRDFSSHKSARL